MTPFQRNELAHRLAKLARNGVFIGTSSWKYEGWLAQVYTTDRYTHHGQFSKAAFNRTCLQEYAETFKTVCLDSAYYRFPEPPDLQFIASQVPDDFLFAIKVTDQITIRRFPNLARFGPRAGQLNPDFLNPDLFASKFIAPCEVIKPKIALLIFEFSTFHKSEFERGRDFVAALDTFLGRIPKGWPYGVEIRNSTFLEPLYFEVLRKHGATHVFNSWERMPPLPEQLKRPSSFTNDLMVAARLLLDPGHPYALAVKEFSPYDRIVRPSPSARTGAVEIIRSATGANPKRAFIYVNNRLEGNAPQTIWAILDQAGA
ncbi:MAG: DUF72 domain-containing protein [Verrucomicrobiia bacterium]